jgi:hypothetical protein
MSFAKAFNLEFSVESTADSRFNGPGLATTGNTISYAHLRVFESEIEPASIRGSNPQLHTYSSRNIFH